MFPPGLSVTQQLDELGAVLGLHDLGQDWGIVNADPSRVAEFASFFEHHYDEQWSAWTVADFLDLVFDSASDAILADPDFPVSCIDTFCALAAPLVPEQFAYWRSNDWPISPHLRHLAT